jgi:uncharacterized membrane-anchored protein YitT (DUF2179 family)
MMTAAPASRSVGDRFAHWPHWHILRDYALILVGAAVLAFSLHLFLIPAQLVAGGLSGAAQLINSLTGWPVGTLIFIGNIPLFVLGWKMLGGRRFLARTVFASFAFSAILDGLAWLWPNAILTDDLLLDALYGGVVAGIGAGLVFRAQATTGGTDILARILERRFSMPLSQGYLLTDGLIVLLAGLAFGWERALYSVVALYIGGAVMDVVINGSKVSRVVTIITRKPEAVAQRILHDLQRGVTEWDGRGVYTGQEKTVLLTVVGRAEIAQLKAIIHEEDAAAFVIVGQAQETLGEGFRRLADGL